MIPPPTGRRAGGCGTARSSPRQLEPSHDVERSRVELAEANEQLLDLLLGPAVDLAVRVGAGVGVRGLDVLTDHDERHERELHDVAEEEQESERIRKGFVASACQTIQAPMK